MWCFIGGGLSLLLATFTLRQNPTELELWGELHGSFKQLRCYGKRQFGVSLVSEVYPKNYGLIYWIVSRHCDLLD